ncbi:hypothetical protein TREMEDRAFT_18910, partial [Tremella mesenterica DSM 1558]|uniref:uncharacterized protein n=1 Tax=Tremella mesenterica (strain ATCC 24925 / CBS 8224 / DSM 1558 / NBRC 9311 / NRRL Y-6157 / RJB 2259-6 / UBC 559-6) TaxID=578456 RepID=UPI0003F490C7
NKDPNHPYLHYHPLPFSNPTKIALTFLPFPPRNEKSILGWIPVLNDTNLGDFKENPDFLKTLHSSIQSALKESKAPEVEYEASIRPGDGYIHITDQRATPPAGRIGDIEDIIATIFVKDGKIVPSTYTPMPTYRLITSNGPLVLPPGLAEHLIEVLRSIEDQ